MHNLECGAWLWEPGKSSRGKKRALLGIFESSVSSYLQPGGKSVKVKIIFSSQSPAHLSITLCVAS